jgi:hypothetical protein
MKTKVLTALVVAGAMTFAACNKKVDEKTMGEINQFGTDWTAMGEKVTMMGNTVTETCQHAKDVAMKQTEMMNGMMNSKDEGMKTKMQEMVKMSGDNVTGCEGMMNDYTAFKTTWDENTKAFTDWQGKVVGGGVTPDEAVKGLADWRTKMTDAQTKMDTWNTAFNTMKENTDKNMAQMDEMSKSMTTTDTHGKMKK